MAFTRAKESLIIIKRNEESVNGNYPSYFKGIFKYTFSRERFLESKEQILSVKKKAFKLCKNLKKLPCKKFKAKKGLIVKNYILEMLFTFYAKLKLPKGENFQILTQRCKSNLDIF